MVRDGWLSYQWYQQCEHSLCNAHLLRDLTYIGEAEPKHKKWSSDLIDLLLEIKETVDKARFQSQTQLEDSQQTDFLKRFDTIITKAEKAIRKTSGLTAEKLCQRLRKKKSEILKFMFDFTVPFDNNGSERDLRMLKLQQILLVDNIAV